MPGPAAADSPTHSDTGIARADFLELTTGLAQLNKALEAQSVLLTNLMKEQRAGWMAAHPPPLAPRWQGAMEAY